MVGIYTTVTCAAFGQTIGDYQSNGAVNWTAAANWQRWNGTSWVAAATAPSANTFANNTITVLSGNSLTVTSNSTITYTLGANNTLVLAGTATISNTGNATLDFTIDGNLQVDGTIIIGASGNNHKSNLNINGTIRLNSTTQQITFINSGGNGANRFTLGPSANLFTKNSNGVYGASSAISNTNVIVTLPTTANYGFDGAAQSTTGLPATVNNLTFSGSGTKTIGGSTLVNGILTVSANTSLAIGSNNLSASSVNLQCGASTSSASITGTGILTLGGNINVTNSAGGTIGANISTPIALGATRTITVADDGTSAADLTISSVISGTGFGIIKNGAGTLALSGTNTFSGGATLNTGTLNIGNTSALGAASGTFTIAGGSINASSPITTVNYPIALNGDFSFIGTNSLNLGTGTVTMNADRQITVNANTLTIGGVIAQSTRSLTKSGNGTLSFGSNSVDLNSLSINAGTLVSSSGNLSLQGNFNNSGTFTHNSGTVIFAGTSAIQTITSSSTVTFNNLTTNKAVGNVVLANNITVGGALTLTAGALNLGSNTLTINGTVSSAGGTLGAGSGTVTFSGTAPQNVPTGIFTSNTIGNLNILNATGVTFNSSTAVTGTMTVNGLFTPTSSAVLSGGTLTGSGTIQVNNTTVPNSLAGQYTQTTKTTSGLTVEFNGAAAQSVDALTYGSLKISNSNGAALNGSATAGSLNLNAGILSIGNNTLTVNGAVSRTAGALAGSISSSLTLGGAAGTLFFDNSGANNYLKVLTINNGASATLGNALNIADYDGTAAEGRLSVIGSGILNTGGFLTLKSTANGTARVAPGNTAGGYIIGDVTVERYIPQNATKAWRLLASNTIGQTINQAWQEGQANSASNTNPGLGTMIAGKFTTIPLAQAAGFDTISPGPSLYKYDGATDSLVAVPNTNLTQLSSEQGYFLYLRGDRSPGQFGSSILASTHTTLRSKGTLFQGNQPVTNIPANQFILLRNPYASAIDVRFIAMTGGVTGAFQIWDPKLAGGYNLGGFQTIFNNGSEYVITPGGGSYASAGSPVTTIESGSAFFMQTLGSAGTVQITEGCKTPGSKVVMRPAGATGALPTISTKLYYVSGGNLSLADGNVVIFDNAFSNDVSNEDVKKNTNFGEDLAIAKAGYNLVVDKRTIPSTEDSVVFSVQGLKRSNYRLEVNSTAPVPGMYATLEDKFTNSSILLNLTGVTTYDFSVNTNPASSAANRFQIKFTPAVVLPIVFTSIKAAQVNKDVNVEWKVTNQGGIAKYEIEKSNDGRSFAIAGSQAIQNGAGELTYNWLDKAPKQGANYYRIKSVDAAGKVAYTSIAKVIISEKGTGFGLYPNPLRANESLSVQLVNQPAGSYNVRITSAAGQEVYKQVLTHAGGSASQNINTPANMAKGVYQVRVISREKVIATQQLVIEN